jgi:hypothetical protein
MDTKRFIQAIKTGDFERAHYLIQSYPLTISHADCNKIMELMSGAKNHTLHRFTEFRPILIYMINKTKHKKEIYIESTYVDYAFIGVFQGDGQQNNLDYLVNLGHGKMKKICL